MASSSSASHHTRSNSLPSTANPFVSQFDEQLSRLNSSNSASSSSTTFSSINSKLTHLNQLYDCVGELLQLPSQKNLAQDSLEGSIELLDICSSTSDVLVQMKERAQELQSILRRRCSKDEIAKQAAEYLKSRKTAKKAVSKALKELKKIECKYVMDSNEMTRLRECQMMTLNVLESVLVAIAGPKAALQSVVFKLLKSKRVASQQETDFFLVGFEVMDAALHPEKVRSQLEKMESNIKDVEQGMECLFRHLIKTRTTILNILNC